MQNYYLCSSQYTPFVRVLQRKVQRYGGCVFTFTRNVARQEGCARRSCRRTRCGSSSSLRPALARGSQKHEIDCVNKKTKLSLVYVFRWQAFEAGQNRGLMTVEGEKATGNAVANKSEMMQRPNGIEIDKECDEIKNEIYSLVAFPVYCQLTLMRSIIGEKLIAAARKESDCDCKRIEWKISQAATIGRQSPSINQICT